MSKLRNISALVLLTFASGFAPAAAGGPPLPECTCRLFGENVPLGTSACLRTPQGPRLAVCSVEQNVTSWRPSVNLCNEASNGTPRPVTPPG